MRFTIGIIKVTWLLTPMVCDKRVLLHYNKCIKQIITNLFLIDITMTCIDITEILS